MGLCLFAGIPQTRGDEGEGFPFHEMDPYPVEAGERENRVRSRLHDSGRLFYDGDGAARSVTWISREELLSTGAARIEDTFWRIPGAATQARFGVITVPTLRGDAAETLMNGQRRGDNLFGLPLTFTAVESLEIIAGPTLLQAGVGKRTGGMVNVTTKAAVLGESLTIAEVRLGTWVPGGGSYATLESTLDTNISLGDRQALRLAVGFREDDTFYHRNGGRDDYLDFYAAYQWRGHSGQTLDWMALFHESDRPQTLGVNRPWQGLMDRNAYPVGMVDPQIGLSDPPGILDPGIADPGLLTGGGDDLVKIPADRVLLSRGDIGEGGAYLSQLIFRKPFLADMAFEQLVLVERVSREKHHQFLYAEDVEQLTLDSLTRLKGLILNEIGLLTWEMGGHLRLEERENKTNYWNEFAYAFDLTTGRRFSATETFPEYLAPGSVEDAGGRAWYLPSSFFSTPESSDSSLKQGGIYVETQQTFQDSWTLGTSLRVDYFDVQANEPRDLVPAGGWSDREIVRLASGSVHLRKDWENLSLYLLAGLYRGMAGNTVGDGVNLYAPGELHREDFLNRSRLIEAGGHWQPLAPVGLRWAVFDQNRTRQEFFGSNDIKVRGLDLSLDWRNEQGTRFMVNGHFLDARYDRAAPAEFGGGSLWNVYAEGSGPTGEGNGIGYIRGFFVNSLPPGDYRLTGLSRWQISGGMEQPWGDNWIVRLWGGWASAQEGNLAGEYRIPAQMEWNTSLEYRRRDWSAMLLVRNILDAHNWIHNGDTFFNQMLVSRNLPLRLEGRIRLLF